MAFALQNGAAGVMAFRAVEEAFRLREEQGDACLLGGERGGIKIDGFDLSNSPDDYGPNVVRGKTIGFTTTNGTKALLKCREASRILIGAFVNISVVAKELAAENRDVHIVCAGTNGAITGEDVLFAGALTDLLQRSEQWLGHPAAVGKGGERTVDPGTVLQRQSQDSGSALESSGLNELSTAAESSRTAAGSPSHDACDSTEIAVSYWTRECGELTAERLEPALRRAQGGRNLIKLGYDKDIATAATVDCLDIVGEVGDDGTIRAIERGTSG